MSVGGGTWGQRQGRLDAQFATHNKPMQQANVANERQPPRAPPRFAHRNTWPPPALCRPPHAASHLPAQAAPAIPPRRQPAGRPATSQCRGQPSLLSSVGPLCQSCPASDGRELQEGRVQLLKLPSRCWHRCQRREGDRGANTEQQAKHAYHGSPKCKCKFASQLSLFILPQRNSNACIPSPTSLALRALDLSWALRASTLLVLRYLAARASGAPTVQSASGASTRMACA